MEAQERDAIITKLQTSNNNKFIYGIYITRIQSSIANICQKWFKKLKIIITETKLSQCFELIRKITTETKMQHFQLKLLHRILTTNISKYVVYNLMIRVVFVLMNQNH